MVDLGKSGPLLRFPATTARSAFGLHLLRHRLSLFFPPEANAGLLSALSTFIFSRIPGFGAAWSEVVQGVPFVIDDPEGALDGGFGGDQGSRRLLALWIV